MILAVGVVRVSGGGLDRDWLDYVTSVGGLVALVIAIVALVFAVRADRSAGRSANAAERSAQASEASAVASAEQARQTREIADHQRATVDELQKLFAEASRERADAAERLREERLGRLAETLADFIREYPVLKPNELPLRAHKLRIHGAISGDPASFQACAHLLRVHTETESGLPGWEAVQAAEAEVQRELRTIWERAASQ